MEEEESNRKEVKKQKIAIKTILLLEMRGLS